MLKNANQIAVSHPFVRCDDSQLLKRSPPPLHANVNAPTTIAGWVEKKNNTCISCSLLPLRFHFRDKPLWPTLSRSIASLKYFAIPHDSETTLDVFPYLHTNADVCWLCTPVSCHANPVQLIALLKLCFERLWKKLTDASCLAHLHCQIIKDNTVCFIFKIVPVVHITAKIRKRNQW